MDNKKKLTDDELEKVAGGGTCLGPQSSLRELKQNKLNYYTMLRLL